MWMLLPVWLLILWGVFHDPVDGADAFRRSATRAANRPGGRESPRILTDATMSRATSETGRERASPLAGTLIVKLGVAREPRAIGLQAIIEPCPVCCRQSAVSTNGPPR